MKMILSGLKKFSLVDYPGQSACLVFLAGCNYRCPWCGYSDYLNEDQSGMLEKSFWRFLDAEKDKLTGCVVSGGEPTIHKELPSFLREIHKRGYKVKLETNGSNPEMLEELIKDELVDCVSLDLKAPKEKYGSLIGFPEEAMNYLLSKIDRSISLLKEGRVDYEFKTTVADFLSKDDIMRIVKWVKPAKKFVLVNFKSKKTLDPEFSRYQPFAPDDLIKIRDTIAPFFDICEIR